MLFFRVSATRQTSDQDSSAGQRGGRAGHPSWALPCHRHAPGLGSAPAQHRPSIRAAGPGQWAAGSTLQGWGLCCSVTDTWTCISKGSSGQQPPNHTPWAFHRNHHSHSKMPNPLTQTVSVPGTGLQTGCKCEREFSLIISAFHRDDSGEPAGAPQADQAGGTPVFQVLQVMNTLPFQDLGWAKDTLSFIKSHFRGNWLFWLGFLMFLGNANIY